MREDALQQLVMDAAKAHGLLAYHTHDSRRSNPGWPDVVLVGARGVLFRELKAEQGRVSPMQKFWLQALDLAGANSGIWRPEDWPTRIVREMRALGRLTIAPPQPSQAELRRKLATRKK